MGRVLYHLLWTAGGWGCTVFHDCLHSYDVVLPGGFVYFSSQSLPVWTDGSVDWHVRGLDSPFRDFYRTLSEWEVAACRQGGMSFG